MAGDERVRFCGQCRQHVYNLSALSAASAATLLRANEGRMCVRVFRRDDGTVITRDCSSVRRAAPERFRRLAFRLSAFVALLLGLAIVGVGRRIDGDGGVRLRDVEPFKRVFDWLAPNPPVSCVMGEAPILPAPAPVGAGPNPPAARNGAVEVED